MLSAAGELPTFGEFFERYMKGRAVANRQKPSSLDSKERIWKNYLAALNGVAAEDVQLFKGAKESAIRLLEGPKFGDMLETGSPAEVQGEHR